MNRRNLPIALESEEYSFLDSAMHRVKAALACHEWQHGPHIDSLPKEPLQKYSSAILLPTKTGEE